MIPTLSVRTQREMEKLGYVFHGSAPVLSPTNDSARQFREGCYMEWEDGRLHVAYTLISASYRVALHDALAISPVIEDPPGAVESVVSDETARAWAARLIRFPVLEAEYKFTSNDRASLIQWYAYGEPCWTMTVGEVVDLIVHTAHDVWMEQAPAKNVNEVVVHDFSEVLARGRPAKDDQPEEPAAGLRQDAAGQPVEENHWSVEWIHEGNGVYVGKDTSTTFITELSRPSRPRRKLVAISRGQRQVLRAWTKPEVWMEGRRRYVNGVQARFHRGGLHGLYVAQVSEHEMEDVLT